MFNPLWLLPGYLLASLIHLAINQFPSHPMEVMIVTLVLAPMALIGAMRFGEGETQQWLLEDSEAHRRWLEEWKSGSFPSDASGQRIAALAAQLKPEQAELVRDRHLEEGQAEQIRAAIARLEEVQKAIGRVGYAALSRRLPFSRNDDWELSELKELLDRN